MENRFGRLIYATLLLLLFSAPAFAQPYRKLTSGEFRGVPRPGGNGEIAFTKCDIAYSYTAHPHGRYYQLDFNIKLVLNSQESWMDRKRITSRAAMEEILKHEQGHYNLAYLEQQELLRTVTHTFFTENFREVAAEIFNRIDAKYQALNRNYDIDTQNSANRVQQHSWDVYFERVLSPIVGNRYFASASENEETFARDNR